MGEDTQVLVRFVTKLPAELRVPPAEVVRPFAQEERPCVARRRSPPFIFSPCRAQHFSQAVPATLKRYGLSQIINHLLALGACLFLLQSSASARCRAAQKQIVCSHALLLTRKQHYLSPIHQTRRAPLTLSSTASCCARAWSSTCWSTRFRRCARKRRRRAASGGGAGPHVASNSSETPHQTPPPLSKKTKSRKRCWRSSTCRPSCRPRRSTRRRTTTG